MFKFFNLKKVKYNEIIMFFTELKLLVSLIFVNNFCNAFDVILFKFLKLVLFKKQFKILIFYNHA